MKNEEENEEQQERKKMKCWFGIGSKAYNLMYKLEKSQKKIPNSYGENDPFIQINSTLKFFEKRGYTL